MALKLNLCSLCHEKKIPHTAEMGPAFLLLLRDDLFCLPGCTVFEKSEVGASKMWN